MTLRWGARTGLALLLVAVLTQKVFAEVLWLDPLPAGNEHPYPGLGGNFTLDSATGAASLSDYQGKVVLLFFGYTFCPDICPTTLTVLGQVLQTLDGDQLDHVQLLFISLDPERDLPQRMADYSAFFHPTIRGLTGTVAQIAQVAKQYGVLYQAVPAPGSALEYSVDHSGVIYVLGRGGDISALIQHGSSADEVSRTIRAVLVR